MFSKRPYSKDKYFATIFTAKTTSFCINQYRNVNAKLIEQNGQKFPWIQTINLLKFTILQNLVDTLIVLLKLYTTFTLT